MNNLDLLAQLRAERVTVLGVVAESLAEIDAKIGALEATIKGEVVRLGVTMRGDSLEAVFVEGKTTWDGKKLEGYEAAHPEISAFKKVGKPYATIRPVKNPGNAVAGRLPYDPEKDPDLPF
jgi:hypothetical protein